MSAQVKSSMRRRNAVMHDFNGICKDTFMKKHFMICVENRGYEASLEFMKVYEVLADRTAEKHHQVRVVDESGEDYLYPENINVTSLCPLWIRSGCFLNSICRARYPAGPGLLPSGESTEADAEKAMMTARGV